VFHIFGVKEELVNINILSLRHLKRIRLNQDLQMLAVPRYSPKSKDGQPLEYFCFLYKSEERVLSDIIYSYKECRDFPPDV